MKTSAGTPDERRNVPAACADDFRRPCGLRRRGGSLDLSRRVRAGDGQRFHRIRPGFSRGNDVRALDRVTSHRGASRELPDLRQRLCDGDEACADPLDRPRIAGRERGTGNAGLLRRKMATDS